MVAVIVVMGLISNNKTVFCSTRKIDENQSINSSNANIRLKYIVDSKSKKIYFSQDEITIKTGECFSLATSDLIIHGGSFINYLDVDWNDSANGKTFYSFQGIKQGNFILKFRYTKSNIEGIVNVSVKNGPKHKLPTPVKRVFYKINNNSKDNQDAITFSENNLTLKHNQKLLLLPDPSINYEHNLLIDGEYYDYLNSVYFLDAKGDFHLFKAVNKGVTNIECHVAHSYFLKGNLKVTVTD